MNFSNIISELKGASLFDLYRLSVAIDKELEDPYKLDEIRYSLRVGETIEYFADNENRLIEAEILEIKRTRVLVKNKHDLKLWNIPFHMINLDGIPVDIAYSSKTQGLSKNEIKIGDFVGFKDRDGNPVQGRVLRANPKTVTIFVEPNQKWKVSYSMLHFIVDEDRSRTLKLPDGTTIIE